MVWSYAWICLVARILDPSAPSPPPPVHRVVLYLYRLVMLWVAGCVALRCTVAPGRVVCHAWFVFWVRHVLSSRVVLQHVPRASVFCGCVWYEAGLRSCHFMSRHVVSSSMSCHVMSCHVMSCHVMSRHVMSCHVRSLYVTSCPVMLVSCLARLLASCHGLSSLVTLRRRVTSNDQ